MGKPKITWGWEHRPPTHNGLIGQRWVLAIRGDPDRQGAITAMVVETRPNEEYVTVLGGVRYAFRTRAEAMQLAEVYRRLTC